MKRVFNNETQTLAFAKYVATCCQKLLDHCVVIHLIGDLGAGKTTFARGFIQTFGFDKVKSPTYSLVESYENRQVFIHHFDCYRLSDPEELDFIGIREYLSKGHIQLVEWPEMGQDFIAKADIEISLKGDGDKRDLSLLAKTELGESLKKCIER